MVSYHPDQRFQTIEEVIDQTERILYRQQRRETELLQQRPVQETQPEPTTIENDLPAVDTPQTTVFTGPVRSASTSAVRFQRRRSSRKRRPSRRSERDDIEDRVSWKIQTGDEVRGTARWDGTRVTIGSYDRYVYAVDPSEGTTIWKFPTGNGVVARPARAGELYVVGSEDGSIYGIDAESGALRWSCRTGRAVRSSTTVMDGIAFTGSDDGSIYALEALTGDIAWRTRLWGPVRSSATIVDDRVLIGSDDGYLYCLDRARGTTIWREPCGGPVRTIPAARDGAWSWRAGTASCPVSTSPTGAGSGSTDSSPKSRLHRRFETTPSWSVSQTVHSYR
ncbi:MAG: PQQ-binding-like beta-propeller repeat protein [Thermomicrobiales bacterium]